MSKADIEAVVCNILSAVLKCAASPDARRDEMPQWDSLKHIEVIFAVEDEFQVRFSEEILTELNSVQKIVAAVWSRNEA